MGAARSGYRRRGEGAQERRESNVADVAHRAAMPTCKRHSGAVRNLLTNALAFTPAGGHVGVDVARDGFARLTVWDTGAGIPPDELPHVFERFWRGSRARNRSGSGIGLAVVDELVRAHGGTVAAESTPGQGTRFVVRLPPLYASSRSSSAPASRQPRRR